MHKSVRGGLFVLNVFLFVVVLALGFVLTIGIVRLAASHKQSPQQSMTAEACTADFCPILKSFIYVYPDKKEIVSLRLDFSGELTGTTPLISKNRTWSMEVDKDSAITSNDKQYSYLYWEGRSGKQFDLRTGFNVRGSETEQFLRDKLDFLGLNEKERNDFISYWLPKMKNNKYNIIHFATNEYTGQARLTAKPAPDSMQRVFMVFKGADEAVDVEEQQLEFFSRRGSTLIEWGGAELPR